LEAIKAQEKSARAGEHSPGAIGELRRRCVYTLCDFYPTQYNTLAMPDNKLRRPTNRLIRFAQSDQTAAQVMASIARCALMHAGGPAPAEDDYTQIDPALAVADGPAPAPEPGVGYGGFTPQQRGTFLSWLEEPATAAPPSFQQLYLAHLEVNLLEGGPRAAQSFGELRRLSLAPAWHEHEGLARTTLLACWLVQDGAALAGWIADGAAPPALLGLALGLQALLATPLHREETAKLLHAWRITQTMISPVSLDMRLRSLATNLQAEPLAYALEQLGADSRQPKLWRCQHRDLRLALPQPNVRPFLEPLLVEMMAVSAVTAAQPDSDTVEEEQAPLSGEEAAWRLILEYGQSRSELFDYALRIAQQMPTFVQLMDENRKLVYRVTFKRQEMRHFWRLWDYTQGWSTAQVYLNGQALERWKIFPYSQYLR
jgi:hypothetical protein